MPFYELFNKCFTLRYYISEKQIFKSSRQLYGIIKGFSKLPKLGISILLNNAQKQLFGLSALMENYATYKGSTHILANNQHINWTV